MKNGIINVYKEPGFTSFDVVAKLRGILHERKIGHTGTLDPEAFGVLPVCIGNATKLCDMLTDKDKTYETVMVLGMTTDTQDTTGEVIKTSPVNVSEAQVKEAINSFVGDYNQIPPMYSALKVNGKKLYEYARAGIEVERTPRPVKIYDIRIIDIKLPYVTMEVTCSKGTYIRTLCHDIGEKLGCGACVKELKRSRVSCFDISDSLKLSQIEELVKEGNIDNYIVSVEEVFEDYGRMDVKSEADRLLLNGNKLLGDDISQITEGKQKNYKVYTSTGTFIGVYAFINDEYKPVKMFLSN